MPTISQLVREGRRTAVEDQEPCPHACPSAACNPGVHDHPKKPNSAPAGGASGWTNGIEVTAYIPARDNREHRR
jgi:ribosomal protein S12